MTRLGAGVWLVIGVWQVLDGLAAVGLLETNHVGNPLRLELP